MASCKQTSKSVQDFSYIEVQRWVEHKYKGLHCADTGQDQVKEVVFWFPEKDRNIYMLKKFLPSIRGQVEDQDRCPSDADTG